MKIGFFGFIFLILFTLKIAQVGIAADMSWVWVFSPIWLPILVLIVLGMIANS